MDNSINSKFTVYSKNFQNNRSKSVADVRNNATRGVSLPSPPPPPSTPRASPWSSTPQTPRSLPPSTPKSSQSSLASPYAPPVVSSRSLPSPPPPPFTPRATPLPLSPQAPYSPQSPQSHQTPQTPLSHQTPSSSPPPSTPQPAPSPSPLPPSSPSSSSPPQSPTRRPAQTPRYPRPPGLPEPNQTFHESVWDNNADLLRSQRLAVVAEKLSLALQKEHEAREGVMKATLNWYMEVTGLLLQRSTGSPNGSPSDDSPLDGSPFFRQNTHASFGSKAALDALATAPFFSYLPNGNLNLSSLDSSSRSALSSHNTTASSTFRGNHDTLFNVPYYPFLANRWVSPSSDSTRATLRQNTLASATSDGIQDALVSAPLQSLFTRHENVQELKTLPFEFEEDNNQWMEADAALSRRVQELISGGDDDRNHTSDEDSLQWLSEGSGKKRQVRFSTMV